MKNVEDIYPVSPMQEVMLLHALARRERDTLLNQFVFSAHDGLDISALEGAFQLTATRHPILRTAFIVDKVKAPLQVVRREIALKIDTADWRDLSPDAQAKRLTRYCETDRAAGMNPTRAPLMRLFAAQTGRKAWTFVWTSHHLIMDRWCLDIVLGDVADFYHRLRHGERPEPTPAPSFRLYINWLSQQDRAAARRYWADYLRGFTTPTSADPAAKARAEHVAARTLSLDADERRRAVDAARSRGVTLGTLIQAAWALTIHRVCGAADIVFGVAVAARPPQIDQVEAIVGSFVNNLPVRARLDGAKPVGDWLKSMQADAYARSAHDFLSPADIHGCSALADDQPLFDSLLVWLAPTAERTALPLTPRGGDLGTAYPLTLSVSDDPTALTLHIHRRAQPDGHARRLLTMLAESLQALVESAPDARLGDLPHLDASRLAPGAGDAASVALTAPADSAGLSADLDAGRERLGGAHMRELVLDEMRHVLELDEIGPDDDFFALGGDSIRAARLHSNLVAGTRRNVPLLALFRQPTARDMARTLAQGSWPMTAGIALALQPRGREAPLFCVASPEVNTIGYFVLSRHLKAPRPSFVLQAPPSAAQLRQVHPEAIPDLARDYVAAMRAVQPAGPYHLLGMCTGAHLAVEMARQLTDAGERVGYLAVVNTWAFYTVSPVYYLHRARNVLAYYARRVRTLLPFGGGDGTEQDGARPDPQDATATVAPEEVGLGNPWIRDYGFAHKNPRRPVVPTTVHVYRTQRQQYWRVRDRALGWGLHVADVRVVDVSGEGQSTILREPHVRDIAAKIDAALAGHDASHAATPSAPLPTTITTESQA